MKKLTLCLFMLIVSCSSSEITKSVSQKNLMYTSFDIVMYTDLPRFKRKKIIDKVWKKLQYLEEDLSPAGNGFLGKLNTDGIITRSENPEVFDIISNFVSLSKNVNQESEGSFDLTVYPLVRLWGFYLQDDQNIPTASEIKDTLTKVGMDLILFTNDAILLKNDAKIDLGAIAKGYAVDVAVDMLKEMGINAGIVNAGGNVKVFGQKPDGEEWRVGIRNPSGGAVEEVVILYDGEAIATSGDYERFFIYNEKIYHHIFDPKTGLPVSHPLASVSVIVKKSAELSDVLATTLLVLGKEKATRFSQTFDQDEEYPLFFIERDQNDQTRLISSFNKAWSERRITN
ncbi:MAG: FAD:protein FMN transferase [Brevinema sp.]